jgi:hypothetical protein
LPLPPFDALLRSFCNTLHQQRLLAPDANGDRSFDILADSDSDLAAYGASAPRHLLLAGSEQIVNR